MSVVELKYILYSRVFLGLHNVYVTAAEALWGHVDQPTQQETKAVTLYEQDHNATAPPSPVETSDHIVSFYISDGFFSNVALCCNGTSTPGNTHGKLLRYQKFSPLFPYFNFDI